MGRRLGRWLEKMVELTLVNLLAAALLIHGIGHVGGYWMLGNTGTLSNSLGGDTARLLGSIIWLVAIIGFAGAGLAVLGVVGGGLAIWRILASISVVISLAVIALFWPGATWNVPAAVFGDVVAAGAIASAPLWA